MFDIGFFEILVIAIVALVVIGPERMPETVRAVGLWIGRLKRSLRDTRNEIERQIGADEIRRQLHNEEVMRSLEKTRQQLEGAIDEGAITPPKTNPKRPYEPEEELPDHAHGESVSTDAPMANADTDNAKTPQTGTEASDAPATEAAPFRDKSSSSKT